MRRTELFWDDYPDRLASIFRPPSELYYRGGIDVIDQRRSVAVIGSRRASDRGIAAAYRIGCELGRRGISVVNGLALGCDTHALRGALAAGGTCVAVMPCGLDQIVPHANAGLAERLQAVCSASTLRRHRCADISMWRGIACRAGSATA